MQSKITRSLVALCAVAALGLPATALAHGKGAGKAHAGKHGQKAPKMRALNVKGTVSAVGDGTIDVLVKKANHHGKALRGQTVTVDVASARIVVHDVNGDGERNLADVAVGDRVLVHSRIAKGATPDPAQPLVAKRVVDRGQPKADPATDETDEETGETTTP
jgi:hypothetical protein